MAVIPSKLHWLNEILFFYLTLSFHCINLNCIDDLNGCKVTGIKTF